MTPLSGKRSNGYNQPNSNGCAVSASFVWGISQNPPQNCVSGNGVTWTDTIRVKDSVWGVRGNVVQEPTNQCLGGSIPSCHEYGPSTQVLKLKPLAAGLKYAASPAFSTVANMSAYYATFTQFRSTADPVSFHSIATPMRFLQRAWHRADSAGTPWPTNIDGFCGSGVPVCDMPVRESGIFWAKERVNGVEREDSVAVNCFVGDSLMDFLAARRRYMDALDSTLANGKEYNFAIVEDNGQLNVVWLPSSSANLCGSGFPALSPGSGFGKIRAYVHTHPARPGEPITCPGAGPGKALPGLSDTDFKYMRRLNDSIRVKYQSFGWKPVPWYAMDKWNVYRLDTAAKSSKDSRKVENTRKWYRGRCKWVRPTDSQVPSFMP